MEEEFEILCEFDESWDVVEVRARRKSSGCPLDVSVKLVRQLETSYLELVNCHDYHVIESLLDAEKIQISRSVGAQLEFGSIRVACFDETFSEFYCDEIC